MIGHVDLSPPLVLRHLGYAANVGIPQHRQFLMPWPDVPRC